MNDEIRTHDEHHARTMGWHGKTIVDEALALSSKGFYLKRWDVQQAEVRLYRENGRKINTPPVIITNDEGEETTQEGKPWQSLFVEGDTIPEGEVLHVSTPYNPDTYSVLTNERFLEIISKSLAACGLSDAVESVGSVFDRQRVFLSIAVPGLPSNMLGHREFRHFLNFINSFNKSTEFMANYSNICTVCNNTLQANLDQGGCLVPHTKNMPEKLDKLPRIIDSALKQGEAFSNDFLRLASEGIPVELVTSLFVAFLENGKALSTRSFNVSERLVQLFSSKTVGNLGQSLADAFSSITDYFSHESAGGNNKGSELKQYQSSEFGAGALAKQQGMRYLLKCMEDKEFQSDEIRRGEALRAEYMQASQVVNGKRVKRRAK